MRKMLALIIALMVLVSPVIAEEIDVDGLGIEALLSLHAQIDDAIQEKLECYLDDNAIYQGVFIVGKDIAPGYYVLTCSEDTKDAGDFDFWYQVYESKEAYNAHTRVYFERFNCGESSSVQLDVGMVFEIVNGAALIQSGTKPKWMP